MALADAVPFAVSHWALDESSGTRYDSVGSSDLSDNNTAGSATGKFGGAASFVRADNEYLSCAYSAALSPRGRKWCLSAWVRLASKADGQHLAGADDGTGSGSFALRYDADTDRIQFVVWGNGGFGSESVAVASTYGSPPTGQWMLVAVYHDPDADLIGISLGGGAYDTDSHSSDVYATAGTFAIGDYPWQPYGGNNADAAMDDVVVLNDYILSGTEVGELWNGGAGVAFADWDAGGGDPPGEGSGSVACVGALAGAGSVQARGSGPVDAVGLLAGAGRAAKSGSGSVAGVGLVAGAGHVLKSGSAPVLAVGTLAGAGHALRSGSAPTACVGTLVGAGHTLHSGSGTTAGVGLLVGAGEAPDGVSAGAGAVAAVGLVVGAGRTAKAGTGTIVATGSLAGAGHTVRSGAGSAVAVGALAGAGLAPGGASAAPNRVELRLPVRRRLDLALPITRRVEV